MILYQFRNKGWKNRANNKKGQSTIEYVVLFIIIVAALLAIGTYFKRAVQGRWKEAVDDLGDQYDPRYANSSVVQRLASDSLTTITIVNAIGGAYSSRTDVSNSYETKRGSVTILSQ